MIAIFMRCFTILLENYTNTLTWAVTETPEKFAVHKGCTFTPQLHIRSSLLKPYFWGVGGFRTHQPPSTMSPRLAERVIQASSASQPIEPLPPVEGVETQQNSAPWQLAVGDGRVKVAGVVVDGLWCGGLVGEFKWFFCRVRMKWWNGGSGWAKEISSEPTLDF